MLSEKTFNITVEMLKEDGRKTMRKTMILIAAALLLMVAAPAAHAEEYTEDGIQIVDIQMLPQVTPPPPPEPEIETRHFEHDPEDIELLARFLWISPLRGEEQKKTLLWVVFNRVDDTSGAFGDTLETVITQREFRWYDPDAKIKSEDLETNRRIAREAMDEWVSEDHGFYVGRHVPKCGVYQEFTGYKNREVAVYKEKEPKERTEPLRW